MAELRLLSSRLDGGLEALVIPRDGRRVAVLTLYFRTGSRFESAADNGLSHLLEHMLFRGVPSHPSSHALAAAFEDLGSTLEASTAADHGNLRLVLPRENVEAAIELLAEVFRAPLLTDLDVERAIIREEILEDYDDRGQLVDPATLLRRLSFGDHGLGQPITGPASNLDRFDLGRIEAHLRTTHVASRTVVAVSGSVDADRTLIALERAFSGIEAGSRPSSAPPAEQTAPRLHLVRHPGGSQTTMTVGFRAYSATSALEPALDMLLRILDDGMATRLYHRLCDQRGLCYDVSAGYEAYEDTGLVEIRADAAHERSLEVLQEILRITDDLAESGVTALELDRARKRAQWQFEALLDEPVDLGDYAALGKLTGAEVTPTERLARLLSVTDGEIREAAAGAFRSQGRSIVIVGAPPRRLVPGLESLGS